MSNLDCKTLIVKGQTDASFIPESTASPEKISRLEIELWQKIPDIFFPDNGATDNLLMCNGVVELKDESDQCEECAPAVSPFSYLVDLLTSETTHAAKTGALACTPINHNAFLILLENYFFQPFGAFSVDCDTLHKEYCRLMLLMEILESYAGVQAFPDEICERLDHARRIFILKTYQTVFAQSESSVEDFLNGMTIHSDEGKTDAALKYCDKPGNEPITDSMWLTRNNSVPERERNAENPEILFEIGDLKWDVLTNPPEMFIRSWNSSCLSESGELVDSSFPVFRVEDRGRQDFRHRHADFVLEEWKYLKTRCG